MVKVLIMVILIIPQATSEACIIARLARACFPRYVCMALHVHQHTKRAPGAPWMRIKLLAEYTGLWLPGYYGRPGGGGLVVQPGSRNDRVLATWGKARAQTSGSHHHASS